MIKWSVILISISAIAKAFCDTIDFHNGGKFLKSDWWLAKGEFAWNNRTWLEANIFSFISDGWHLFDAIRIASLLLIISLLVIELHFRKLEHELDPIISDKSNFNKGLAVALTLIGMFFYHGVIFEIVFNII